VRVPCGAMELASGWTLVLHLDRADRCGPLPWAWRRVRVRSLGAALPAVLEGRSRGSPSYRPGPPPARHVAARSTPSSSRRRDSTVPEMFHSMCRACRAGIWREGDAADHLSDLCAGCGCPLEPVRRAPAVGTRALA
jgi:hypothetical protein